MDEDVSNANASNYGAEESTIAFPLSPDLSATKRKRRRSRKSNVSAPGSHSDSISEVSPGVSQESSGIEGSSIFSANKHEAHGDKEANSTSQGNIMAASKASPNEMLLTADINASSKLISDQEKKLTCEIHCSNTDSTSKVDCEEGHEDMGYLEKSPILKSYPHRKLSRRLKKKKILNDKDVSDRVEKSSDAPLLDSSHLHKSDSQHRDSSGSNLLPNEYSDLSFSVLEEICQTTEMSFNCDTAGHKNDSSKSKSVSALCEDRSLKRINEDKNTFCDKLVNAYSNVIEKDNSCDNNSKIKIVVDKRKEGDKRCGSIYINNSSMFKKPTVDSGSIKTLLESTKLLDDAESVSYLKETVKQKEFKSICRKEKLNDGSYICFESIFNGNKIIYKHCRGSSRTSGKYENKVSCDESSLMEKYNIDMNNTLSISSEQFDDLILNAEKSNYSHKTTGRTTPSVITNSECLNIFHEQHIIPIENNSDSETFAGRIKCPSSDVSEKKTFEPPFYPNNLNRITHFQEPEGNKSKSFKNLTRNATLSLKLSRKRTDSESCARNGDKMVSEILSNNFETNDVELLQEYNPKINRETLNCEKAIPILREMNCNVLAGTQTNTTATEYIELMSTTGKSNLNHEAGGTAPREFSIASGKSISVSEKASINTIKMLPENENNKTAFSGFSTANGKSISVSEDALSKAKTLLTENECCDTDFSGFSTAKRESIPVSAEALTRAKALLQEIESDNKFCGFSTAKGRPIEVSEEALARAKTFLSEKESDDNKFIGFSTARGKPIQVSEEALVKARTLLSEKESCDSDFTGVPTAKGNSIPVSDEALDRAKTLLLEKESDENRFCGFSTANGKSIEVSEESLVKARTLLSEKESCNTSFSGFSTAKGKSIPVSEEALARAKTFLFEKDFDDDKFIGFSNAKGKPIEVSEEALVKARTFLSDKEPLDTIPNAFSTENGKSIPVSDGGPTRARTLFQEDKSDEHKLCGFSTIEGKPIAFTEEALAKAKIILSEKESDFECSRFSTARKKLNEVSGEALVKTRTFLSEKDCAAAFSGFSTAKGKCIQVSEEALSKARNLFSENESDTGVVGSISSVKGNSIMVPVSVEALVQAKNKLQDESAISLKNFSPYHISDMSKDESFNSSYDSKLGNVYHKLDTIEEELLVQDTCIDKQFESQLTPEKNPKSQNLQSQFYEDMPCLSLSFVDEVSESTAAFLADENISESHNNPPVWLKTFVTSPSLIQDRSDALSPILCSDSEVKMRKKRACSPILGLGDRFKKRKKRLTFSKRKLDDTQEAECSIPDTYSKPMKNPEDPYSNFITNLKTSTPISINRTKSKRAVEIDEPNSASEKKLKLMDSWDDSQVDQTIFYQLDVIEGRRKAAEKQELLLKNGKGKSLTKMQKGTLFVKKQLENRIPLKSLVKCPRTMISSPQLIKEGIKQSVLGVTHENAAEFRFSSSNSLSNEISESNCDGVSVGDNALVILSDDGSAGLKEISRAFLASPGIDPTLISQEWIANHYKLIVWKLASTERSIPHLLAGNYLTLDNLLHQLKYRYDREIDECQRPCLRKILETDESAARRMILCVSEVSVKNSSVTKDVKLTDGWYGINASLDEEMMCLIDRGKVAVGTKLVVQGCELLNCEQGHDPLQVSDTIQLKVHTNSARRAKWDSRLGFCQIQGPILVGKLKDILPKGGNIGRIDVLVVRVYPLVYLLKTEFGKTVVYSKKREEQECLLNERKMTELIEKLQSQVQKEMDEIDNQKSNSEVRRSFTNQYDESLSTQDLVESDQIPTRDQMRILSNLREQEQRKYQETLRQKLDEKMSENGPGKRNSIPMLKVRVIDSRPINEDKTSKLETAMLTVWKPTEDVENVLVEGNIISLYHITAQGRRSGELQLSTGRQTKYSVGSKSEAFSRVCHFLSDISPSLNPLFSEINTVGLVVHVESSSTSVETAYLTDHENNFLGVRFWGGIKKYGWQSCVSVGSEISCSNLEWRSNVFKCNVPYVFVSELSVFSCNPRSKYLQNALDLLKNSLKDMDLSELLSKSKEKLLDVLNGGETGGNKWKPSSKICSPAASGESNNSALCAMTSSNKNLITESPMSSFKSKVLLEKMQRLHGYGNPPTITAMPSLQVSPALKKDFKTPNRKSL